MNYITLDNDRKFYYYDADDPVISNLKKGTFFGWNNWMTLKSLINNFKMD